MAGDGGTSASSSSVSAHDIDVHSSESDPDLVHVRLNSRTAAGRADGAAGSGNGSTAGHLVYAKSKVYVHPTSYSRENQPGWMCIIKRARNDFLLAWIPEALVNDSDRDTFVKVEIGHDGQPHVVQDEDQHDNDLVDLSNSTCSTLSSSSNSLAWSIPLSAVYSLVVTPPTLANWYGNVRIYLHESYISSNPAARLPSLPLYFHDDESPSTMFMMDRRAQAISLGRSASSSSSSSARMPSSWGGEDLVVSLKRYANIVKSSLQTNLYLVNPSQTDLEAHSVPLFEDELPNSEALYRYRQKSGSASNGERTSILHQSLSPHASTSNTQALPTLDNLTFSVLSSFSRLTNRAKQSAHNIAHPILSHPLSKPILKHLPPPIASLANANAPEYSSWAEKAGVAGYDAARVYLARWARIVAEEGERARRSEMRFVGGGLDESATSAVEDLGGPFEVLATTYRIARPRSTRVQGYQPIVESEWKAWFDSEGKLMLSREEARKRIFQRGLIEGARRHAWPFLLGVYEWDSTAKEREQESERRKREYERLKDAWFGKPDVTNTEEFIEEHHRIREMKKIDCLRTDRTQPMFSTDDAPGQSKTDEADLAQLRSAQLAASMINTSLRGGDSGGQPQGNYHTQKMTEILLTYNVWETELGYVQGMSDLCSPLYIVLEGDESLVFWCFVNLMEERMKPNFYRDQSGIKSQLSTLQQLIALMDPGLYAHLEKTDSLNLFFCFRWVLIAFKREFKFADCLQVWETLWSAPSSKFHLFLAMSILENHRDVIIRYLQEFDEVLKYVNELSQTLEPQPLLSQAEVLYLGFRNLVEATDRRQAERASQPSLSSSSTDQNIRRRPGKSDKEAANDTLLQLVNEEVEAEAGVPVLEISTELRELLQ